MNLDKNHVAMAVQAGLELLSPESEVRIPTRLNDGVFFLKGLLGALAQGHLALTSPRPEQAEPLPEIEAEGSVEEDAE